MLREGQTLFTYLHLAPDPDQARALMASGVTAIAYETVTGARTRLPLPSRPDCPIPGLLAGVTLSRLLGPIKQAQVSARGTRNE